MSFQGSSPSTQALRRRRLGELLIEAKALDQVRLQAALSEQRRWGGKLGRLLVEMGFIDERTMVRVLAMQLHLPTVDLDQATLPPNVVSHLRVDLAERYQVFPLQLDPSSKTLKLATADPTNLESLQELSFATNLKMEPMVATVSAIERAIRRFYYGEQPIEVAALQTPLVSEAVYELDEVVSDAQAPVSAEPALPKPTVPAPLSAEQRLNMDVLVLREQVASLEQTMSTQARSLRALLELLIEADIIHRDEYFAKSHQNS